MHKCRRLVELLAKVKSINKYKSESIFKWNFLTFTWEQDEFAFSVFALSSTWAWRLAPSSSLRFDSNCANCFVFVFCFQHFPFLSTITLQPRHDEHRSEFVQQLQFLLRFFYRSLGKKVTRSACSVARYCVEKLWTEANPTLVGLPDDVCNHHQYHLWSSHP